MSHLKGKNWRHGGTMLQADSGETRVVWTQQATDGWFAKLEDEQGKLMVLSGPWSTQRDAEHELIDAVQRVVIGTEGE